MKPIEKARKCAAKKWRSRLLARAGDIFRWRKDGVSFRDIAERLKREGLDVSHSAVASFVRARLPKPATPEKLPIRRPAPLPRLPAKPGGPVLTTITPIKREDTAKQPKPKRPFIDPDKLPEYLRTDR